MAGLRRSSLIGWSEWFEFLLPPRKLSDRRIRRLAGFVLEGEAPLEMLDTTEGAREVEDLLHRIDHGLAV